jgi:uncharacterized protein (DUF2267 family)
MISVFSRTLQKSIHLIDDIVEELDLETEEQAYQALRATLHTLRDRMPPDEAVHLGAQLPMLIRGMYYEGWKPAATPVRLRNVDDFFEYVQYMTGSFASVPAQDPVLTVRGVLEVLDRHLGAGEIDDVLGTLPREVLETVTGTNGSLGRRSMRR